ncbi:MAG: DUF1156 domain-containing protein [Prosthecobacter sp.]|uniref:DUF1156 domain-containing protein n=1 Tax=Prosthecobacter sp. TaxID=1965333 RepID=UPI00261801A6|nr:DUF1156 domain-containing protein [Prosthecobacter sp.]MCF7789458.1 DUF1156 domain-containing protein [Prosthecobacter sp.]
MPHSSRLIEHAFPLKQASLDSVHEKNVRHGHISTLHIWPARRPLAASRAALIATLLPDPGTPEKRRELCEKIGGVVKEDTSGERIKEFTEGGILHWKRETENAAILDELRAEIRAAYCGRAPRVLDPFAGGGAIPLEAMRLGCEVTAADINPVAWFLLRCTLEYPQQFAGKKEPLPDFILKNRAFMERFFTAQGLSKSQIRGALDDLGHKGGSHGERDLFADSHVSLQADLSWHVRAWGLWVLDAARRELAPHYPTYADYQPLKPGLSFERQPMRLVPLDDEGKPDIARLNESSADYLADSRNPRWVAKPTVAYLWARTVPCKACRALLPLLKTCWLSRKNNKRVLLIMEPLPDKSGVSFGIETDVPARGGNAAQKREHDKKLGAGTMSRAGAKCPCCGAIMTQEDIRYVANQGRMDSVLTAVVNDGPIEREYRLPKQGEIDAVAICDRTLERLASQIPFGSPNESIPEGGSRSGGGSPFTTPIYNLRKWSELFSPRQLSTLFTFVARTRLAVSKQEGSVFAEGIAAYLTISINKLVDRGSAQCRWDMGRSTVQSSFARFALPLLWDYCEANPFSETTGNWLSCVEWVALSLDHCMNACANAPAPRILNRSAIVTPNQQFDVIVTDPPYYDAIPYSDLMDFFYVWLRRTTDGLVAGVEEAFAQPLSPKWNHDTKDGELVDDAARHGNDKQVSKQVYEEGMARAFQACHASLVDDGRLVIVFAHKHPDAWETLVSAIIRAGFVVGGSWPIATEMANRTRALAAAALSSSVWLVCRKRPAAARPGWDTKVLETMREQVAVQLREFWDAGIRGPDFVWAATGPAMEAFSSHPVVRKANEPDALMSVGEFLQQVRRIVVDFVVGRVLTRADESDADAASKADRLDEVTAYYLLHRNDFQFEETPAGTCILYAVSCGLSDQALLHTWDLIASKASTATDDDADSDDEDAGEEQSGGTYRLKPWNQRKRTTLGHEAPGGREIPLIDRVHRLLHLWKAGDVVKVDAYLDDHSLRRHELFLRLLQSLIELSPRNTEERSMLESLSNHVGARGAKSDAAQIKMNLE